MCNKKYLTKDFEKMVLKNHMDNLKKTKHSKVTYFCIVYAHSYTHLSNFRYDLILMVNEIKTFG